MYAIGHYALRKRKRRETCASHCRVRAADVPNSRVRAEAQTTRRMAMDAAIAGDFNIGDAVRFSGLQAARFNGHVGTVTALPGPLDEDGARVGVQLHSAVWRRQRGGGSREPALKSISVRRENLRLVRLPPEQWDAREARVGVLGGPAPAAVPLLLRQLLPPDLADLVAGFFVCLRVDPREVSVARCSSSSGQHPPAEALTPSRDTWWISGPGTTPRGVGRQWLQFELGTTVRRISYLGICIPPLPHGPLSVRDFHVLYATEKQKSVSVDEEAGDSPALPDDDVDWQPCPGLAGEGLHTLDHEELQEFAFSPPLEATSVRLVCTKNAAAAVTDDLIHVADCIGLFEVRFL